MLIDQGLRLLGILHRIELFHELLAPGCNLMLHKLLLLFGVFSVIITDLSVKLCRLLLQLLLKLEHVLDLLSNRFLPQALGPLSFKRLLHSLNLRLLFLSEARVFGLLWIRRLIRTSILGRLVQFCFLGGLLLRFLSLAFCFFLSSGGCSGLRA